MTQTLACCEAGACLEAHQQALSFHIGKGEVDVAPVARLRVAVEHHTLQCGTNVKAAVGFTGRGQQAVGAVRLHSRSPSRLTLARLPTPPSPAVPSRTTSTHPQLLRDAAVQPFTQPQL